MRRFSALTRQWAPPKRLLTVAVGIGMLSGCSPGYPTEDALDGQMMTAGQNVDLLNELGENLPNRIRHEIALIENCWLRFTSAIPAKAPASVLVELSGVETQTRVNHESKVITLKIGVPPKPGYSESAMRSVFETRQWHEAAVFQSVLNQLQRMCAESLTADRPVVLELPDNPPAAKQSGSSK